MEPQNTIVSERSPSMSFSESAPSERAVTEMVQPRKSPVSRATEAVQAIMPAAAAGTILGMSRTRLFTILLILLVVGFLAVKLRPYISYISTMVDLLQTLLTSSIGLAASTSTGIVDNTADGTDVIVDKLSGSSKKKITSPPKASESNASDPKPSESTKTSTKKSPEPDESTSSVQSKSGYCYVGDWKGVRSCVKVNGACESGKVFSTEAECTKT